MARRTIARERPKFPPVQPGMHLRGYVRRSFPGEDERTYSMDAQRAAITRWAAERGVTVEQFYNDPGGKSKADTLARPVLMQAMDDARRGVYDKLIVWKYDRFSRDIELGTQALFQFEAQYGTEVISTLEPVPQGEMGTMMRMLYLFAGDLERTNIIARFIGGRVERVRSGSLPGAPFALYGLVHANRGDGTGRGDKHALYLADWETIDGDEQHAPARVVVYIYRLALTGLTTRQIALRLTRERVPTPGMVLKARGRWPQGKSLSHVWRQSTVGRILTNPAYMGTYEAWRNTVETVTQRNKQTGMMEDVSRIVRRAADDETIVRLDNVVEPLVEAEVWYAVQAKLPRNKQEAARNAVDPEGCLLKNGYAVCGYCGRNMIGKWQKQRHKYLYVCAASSQSDAHDRAKCAGGGFSWQAEQVDGIVWAWLLKQFEQPEVVRAKVRKWQADRVAGRVLEVDRQASLQELLRKATEERNNFMELAGRQSDASMQAHYDLLARQANDQAKGFAEDLAGVEAALAGAGRLERTVDEVAAYGERMRAHLAGASYEEKRAVLFAFGVRATLWRQGRLNAAGEEDALQVSWVLREGVSQTNDRMSQTITSSHDALPRLVYSQQDLCRLLPDYQPGQPGGASRLQAAAAG